MAFVVLLAKDAMYLLLHAFLAFLLQILSHSTSHPLHLALILAQMLTFYQDQHVKHVHQIAQLVIPQQLAKLALLLTLHTV